jgi:K+ transporter
MVGFLLAEYFLPSQVNSSRPAIRLKLLSYSYNERIVVLRMGITHAGTEAMFADLGHFTAASIRV